MVGPDKCQRRGRLGRRNPHSDSEEQPKCAALPPQRGQSCLRLTRQGKRHRFSGEGEAQNGNSGLRIGFTRRSVCGSDRARVVIWIDDHPHAEFVGADDFDFSGEVLSEIKVPGEVGERICRYPDEPIPERYAAFNTAGLPTRIQAQGVHGAWAVVANLCDHKTMTALTAPQFLEYSKEGAKLVNRSKVPV